MKQIDEQKLKKVLEDFKKSIQKMCDKNGIESISLSVEGGEEIVLAKKGIKNGKV